MDRQVNIDEPALGGREMHEAYLRAAEARMDAYLRGDRRDGSAHAAYEEEMDQRRGQEAA
jgi:hypothetical protein